MRFKLPTSRLFMLGLTFASAAALTIADLSSASAHLPAPCGVYHMAPAQVGPLDQAYVFNEGTAFIVRSSLTEPEQSISLKVNQKQCTIKPDFYHVSQVALLIGGGKLKIVVIEEGLATGGTLNIFDITNGCPSGKATVSIPGYFSFKSDVPDVIQKFEYSADSDNAIAATKKVLYYSFDRSCSLRLDSGKIFPGTK